MKWGMGCKYLAFINIFIYILFKNDLQNETCYVIILVATTGEGDPPDNVKPFFRWINIQRSQSLLQSLNFTV